MKFNPHLIKSAKEEWSYWLDEPNTPHFKAADYPRWIKNRPPLHSFALMAETIEVMQDEIDLLNLQLKDALTEINDTRRQLMKRI